MFIELSDWMKIFTFRLPLCWIKHKVEHVPGENGSVESEGNQQLWGGGYSYKIRLLFILMGALPFNSLTLGDAAVILKV